MGNGGVRSRWAFVSWSVAVALFAGAVGGAVALPAGADAQGSAPAASGSMPSVELSAGGAARSVAVGGYFTGAVASYGAASSDSAVVSVSVSGSTVTVTPESAGSATVTVTAANSAGSASQAFAVKVLPAGCVVALGALAAGSVTTKGGSWERGDGCRATNGAGAGGRYARYFTFTVSEPQEAWFRLSSSQAGRLYLLEGAGTGGRVLGAAGDAAATWSASLWRALEPGAYTLETSAFHAAREAAFSVSVDSMPLTPPESCVVSLGAVGAGTAAARSGAWDRDDACRSLNATANRASRYYAAYASFTVAEPFEARFALSSSRGTRLYLLEGAGTGGRVLASSSSRTGASQASFRRTLQPGAYTLEATTYLAAAEAAYTLKVSSPPAAPQPAGALAAPALPAGASADVDVESGFNGRIDAYTAASSDTNVATVTAQGSVLTLTGIAAGTATVTVTATNTAGSAAQSFAVTVTSAAPKAAGALAAPALTAGDSAEVDAAGAFTGAVDTYAVTSSNAAVVDVALTGSVVTLTGIAAGTATVTVTAANAAGSAEQSFTVTANLPPAPTLGAPLAAQALQATETLTVDVASGFDGRIDAYAAASGDTDKLTVTVDGSEATLTGAAAGSTTVTVTAINAAGRAARSFNVTVNALTPPRTAGTPTARTIAVGEELPIHIADAFSGNVHTYTAASNDTAVATATIDGPTVTLTGAAAGSATVTLTAANAAGSASATLSVTVEVPDGLTVAVAAPSHCLGSEGALAPGGGRRGVGAIDVTYHVTGGAPPYTITSPDAPDAIRTEPTGTLTVPCAQRGVDLATAGPDANVVEAGPRTLTLTATDNTGTTTTADIRIEVAEDAYTTEYNNGLMHPGKTYVLGTPDEWVLITLPQGLTLQFSGLSDNNMAHFTEPVTGAEIILDWTTGTEIRRHIPTTAGNFTIRTRTTDTTRTNTLFNQLTIGNPSLEYGASQKHWRPYKGLPPKAIIAVHPNMVYGQAISVCNLQNSPAFTTDIKKGINAWNDTIRNGRTGFNRDLFMWKDSCPTDEELFLEVRYVSDSRIGDYCTPPIGEPAGCAWTLIRGNNPPIIVGGRIYIAWSYTSLVRSTDPDVIPPTPAQKLRVMIEELGHFLGLGDYYATNTVSCENSDHYKSVMASGMCRTDDIRTRDLKDLHSIYHPGRRLLMQFVKQGSNKWRLYAGSPPPDTGEFDEKRRYVSNAERYVVFRHAVGSTDPWEYRGWFSRDFVGSWLVPGEVHVKDDDGQDVLVQKLSIGITLAGITGHEFAVFGITRGDIEQISRRGVEKNATWQFDFDDEVWSLGTPALVYGPPSKPVNLSAAVDGQDVVLSWSSVRGATDYYVHIYRFGATRPFRTVPVDADPSSCSVRAVISGLPTRVTHGFRVEAERSGVSMRSDLSEQVNARLTSGRNPRAARESARASGGSVGGAGSCTIPVEVAPVVEVSGVCPDDGDSWTLRAVDEGFECDLPDSAPVTPGERVVGCPPVVPRYAVVTVGGVEKCRRTLVAAPTASLGDPECEDGFAPVSGGASCSRTDREAATATYSCPPGYTLVTVQGRVCHRSVPASSSTEYSCSAGFSLVAVPLGGRECRKSVPASSSTEYSCSAGYSLVTTVVPFGTPLRQCKKSLPAKASTAYSCSPGFSLVAVPLGGRVCRKSAPASASTKYVCSAGYSLVTTVVPFGTPLRQCKKSLPAKATAKYVCRSGYSLVRIPLGGQYCRKSTAAASSYSCGSGYTRRGATCYKYIYSSPTGTRCPAGYALIYNGLYYQCRKKLTAAATVTYSCSSGTLSGSKCVLTATPASVTVYSCSSGTLSGSKCVLTATPTLKTTYSCSSGTLSGSKCVLTATPTSRTVYSCSSGILSGSTCVLTASPTLKTTYSCSSGRLSGSKCVLTSTPKSKTTYSCSSGRLSGSKCVLADTPTVTYDCDTAPSGYTLSGTDCVKTTTRAPTRPTIYTCPDTHTRVEPADTTSAPTCEKTETINATVATTPASCPTVAPNEPRYQLYEDHVAGTIKHTCERTITITALTVTIHSCLKGYTLHKTVHGNETEYTCRLNLPTPNT